MVSDQLTYAADYTADAHGSHPHTVDSLIYEQQHPESAAGFWNPVRILGERFRQDVRRVKTIEERHYTGVKTFHNTYGSPWYEIYDLMEKIDWCNDYASRYPALQWLGEKQSFAHHMQMVVSIAVDCKWAVIYYQDYLQRGYDIHFNNATHAIDFEDFDHHRLPGNVPQTEERAVGSITPH